MSTNETQLKPILVAESVRKVYRSGADSVVALHGLDLVVPQGEFVAVSDPNPPGSRTEDDRLMTGRATFADTSSILRGKPQPIGESTLMLA